MVSHVLVAVDGSSHADRALEFAAEFAIKYGAGLTILNVVSYASTVPLALGAYAELEGLYAESRSVLQSAGEKIVESAAERARLLGVRKVTTMVELGSPAQTICETSKSVGADVVVMGRRGLGDFSGLFLGSVTHKVAHTADCTVVTVK
ncbi:MAG: universal stress protein [Actinomycetota bacterium]|nr:universal stress protein [Actinomycetota bacterium]